MGVIVLSLSASMRKELNDIDDHPPQSENRFVELPRPKRSHQGHPPGKSGSTGTVTTSLVDDDSRSPKRKKHGSPVVIDVSSENEFSETTVSSNPLAPPSILRAESILVLKQNQLDLVLETTVTGSSEIRLIYCANTYPLSCFMSEVRRKHRLGRENRIMGIKVKTEDKVFDVDLKESRDWGYILGVITKNGGRGEMTVSIK